MGQLPLVIGPIAPLLWEPLRALASREIKPHLAGSWLSGNKTYGTYIILRVKNDDCQLIGIDWAFSGLLYIELGEL
ncbi:hypothetical protein F5Y11DRAFT_314301 [Daldinia sp. FL1419]|nr:hypothetical protein F5Y11DRAFT_314301 [Daldinia sp. FL1419]